MSGSGPLTVANGQGVPIRRGGDVLAAGDRKVAFYLATVKAGTDWATRRLEQDKDPAEVLGELLARLGRIVSEGRERLDPAARLAGERLAQRRIEERRV